MIWCVMGMMKASKNLNGICQLYSKLPKMVLFVEHINIGIFILNSHLSRRSYTNFGY